MIKDSVAIIGGAGFVGTNLARNLKKTDIKYVIYDIDLRDGTENIVKLDVENLKLITPNQRGRYYYKSSSCP